MSSQNVGEELVGSYLEVVKGCEFVSYNLQGCDVTRPVDAVAQQLDIAPESLRSSLAVGLGCE